MKKLLLLFIPLMFLFSCEVFEGDEEADESIVGTWRDNIQGGWVVNSIIESYDCYIPMNEGPTPEVIGYNIVLENPNYELFNSHDGSGNVSTCGIAWLNEDSYLNFFISAENLTIYENGSWSYQTSPISLEEINDLNVGDIINQGSQGAFQSINSGVWSKADNTLTLTTIDGESFDFSILIDGNNLTLDRSLIANEAYITTWEKQ